MSFPPRPRRTRVPASLLAVAAALLLAVPALAVAAAPRTAAPRANAPFTVKVTATTHSPETCVNWFIDVYVTKGAKKLSGRVTHYDFLFSGQDVSGSQPAGDKANHFGDFTHGFFRDNLIFPSAAVNEPLTLQVWVKTSDGTAVGEYSVKAKPNPHKQCKVDGH